MSIHGAGVNVVVVLPHIAQKLLAVLHPTPPAGEDGKQLEFRGGKLNGFAADHDEMAIGINGEFPDHDLGW